MLLVHLASVLLDALAIPSALGCNLQFPLVPGGQDPKSQLLKNARNEIPTALSDRVRSLLQLLDPRDKIASASAAPALPPPIQANMLQVRSTIVVIHARLSSVHLYQQEVNAGC